MLKIKKDTAVYIAAMPIDFRKGIDSLVQLCSEFFIKNPKDGSVFLFCNRRRTSIKILFYDGQGFWLCMKRLSRGRWELWPKLCEGGKSEPLMIDSRDLGLLLANRQKIAK
jgi:transposase